MENEAITAYRQRRAAFEATFERHLAAGVVFYSADGILIDDTVEIAPGAVILPGTILRGETKIGAGSVIGPNSLLENVTVGENVKFNASQGYDSVIESGAAKHRNTIGDYAFIGCNTNLVAPVSVGDGAYTAAGSTITDDVPAGALGIARARQVNKPQWAKGKLEKFIAKQQAKEEAGSK